MGENAKIQMVLSIMVSNGMVILLGIGIVFFGLICIIVLCTIMGAVVRKFAKKPEVIEGNMKALQMALSEVSKIN